MVISIEPGKLLATLAVLFFFASCARAPIERPEQAMRLAGEMPELHEVSPPELFYQNLERNIDSLKSSHRVSQLRFGERVISREDYLRGAAYFLEILRAKTGDAEKWQRLRENFDVYEVYGRKNWGEVFITSYYEPVIEARHKPDEKFYQPLYAVPDDLVEVKLRQFGEEFAKFPQTIRGRLVKAEGNESVATVTPYFSRAEIDGANALHGRGLELAYVDPLESFFLQIQGSGVLHFENGEEVRVGYAGQNGHAYEPVGKFLKQVIPIAEMSLDRIEAYLRSLSREAMQQYLDMNPSYVFFKTTQQNALTYIGTPAEGLRTIATDAKYFPKGAIALLKFQKPRFAEDGHTVAAWEDSTQLMLDQDVGGAIKGADRVDLFWGRGDEAKRYAGLIKQTGMLYYLAPKQALIDQLREKAK